MSELGFVHRYVPAANPAAGERVLLLLLTIQRGAEHALLLDDIAAARGRL